MSVPKSMLKALNSGAYHRQETATDIEYDAAGCMTQIDLETWASNQGGGPNTRIADQTTRHVCGEGGRRVLRETTNNLTGQKKRIIDFAELAEIRPDEGIMLLRVPVNGAVMVEEARSLVDGARDERQSGYRHTDIRGSTLARADGLPSGLVSRIHRPVKLAGAFACCAGLSNLTVSARSLDKPAAPGDLPCARSGNACN